MTRVGRGIAGLVLLGAAVLAPAAANAQATPAAKADAPRRALIKDCEACPQLVIVPPGRFLMGSRADEPGSSSDESPQHEVRVTAAFAIGRYEVTFDEWDACVRGGGCTELALRDMGWGRGRMPAINIAWVDAMDYVRWLAQVTGRPYRLPSEAEWEYAARARSVTAMPWKPEASRDHANFAGTSGRDQWVNTAPVGSLQPNRFGLHDTHGNVWEWVQDCWNPGYTDTPTNGTPSETGDCTVRILRGGSWDGNPLVLRSANRFVVSPTLRIRNFGFRVARAL